MSLRPRAANPAAMRDDRAMLRALLLALLLAGASARAEEDPATYVQFVQDFGATCVSRSGMQILIKNTHPRRTLKVWLDRWHMGVGTGDRSRSELKPGAEPEALGCSRSLTGPQEWRLVKAQFVD